MRKAMCLGLFLVTLAAGLTGSAHAQGLSGSLLGINPVEHRSASYGVSFSLHAVVKDGAGKVATQGNPAVTPLPIFCGSQGVTELTIDVMTGAEHDDPKDGTPHYGLIWSYDTTDEDRTEEGRIKNLHKGFVKNELQFVDDFAGQKLNYAQLARRFACPGDVLAYEMRDFSFAKYLGHNRWKITLYHLTAREGGKIMIKTIGLKTADSHGDIVKLIHWSDGTRRESVSLDPWIPQIGGHADAKTAEDLRIAQIDFQRMAAATGSISGDSHIDQAYIAKATAPVQTPITYTAPVQPADLAALVKTLTRLKAELKITDEEIRVSPSDLSAQLKIWYRGYAPVQCSLPVDTKTGVQATYWTHSRSDKVFVIERLELVKGDVTLPLLPLPTKVGEPVYVAEAPKSLSGPDAQGFYLLEDTSGGWQPETRTFEQMLALRDSNGKPVYHNGNVVVHQPEKMDALLAKVNDPSSGMEMFTSQYICTGEMATQNRGDENDHHDLTVFPPGTQFFGPKGSNWHKLQYNPTTGSAYIEHERYAWFRYWCGNHVVWMKVVERLPVKIVRPQSKPGLPEVYTFETTPVSFVPSGPVTVINQAAQVWMPVQLGWAGISTSPLASYTATYASGSFGMYWSGMGFVGGLLGCDNTGKVTSIGNAPGVPTTGVETGPNNPKITPWDPLWPGGGPNGGHNGNPIGGSPISTKFGG